MPSGVYIRNPILLEKQRIIRWGERRRITTAECSICRKYFVMRNCKRKKYCSLACYWKSEAFKKTQYKVGHLGLVGEKSPLWKGNSSIQEIRHRIRGWVSWRNWRSFVFDRDGYRCLDCGKKGVYLEPHHIIPLKVSLKRVFDVNNGITLCRPCHKKTMGKELELSRIYFSLVQAQV